LIFKHRDIAAILERKKVYDFSKIVYVVGKTLFYSILIQIIIYLNSITFKIRDNEIILGISTNR
jgi:hypothetical protein